MSTASLRLKTLSSIRVKVISSSVGLYRNNSAWVRHNSSSEEHTYLPTRFVLVRGHRGELGVDRDDPFERPFWWGFHHLAIDLRKYPIVILLKTQTKCCCVYTHRVLPMAHSTQPSSGPNVSVGVRMSSMARPSRRKDCFNEPNKKSFSGIDGDGGRGIASRQTVCGLGEESKALK